MNALKTFEFEVPIHVDGEKGYVHVLLTCNALQIEALLRERFGLEATIRDCWEGICVFSPELDARAGCPTAIIAKGLGYPALISWQF